MAQRASSRILPFGRGGIGQGRNAVASGVVRSVVRSWQTQAQLIRDEEHRHAMDAMLQ